MFYFFWGQYLFIYSLYFHLIVWFKCLSVQELLSRCLWRSWSFRSGFYGLHRSCLSFYFGEYNVVKTDKKQKDENYEMNSVLRNAAGCLWGTGKNLEETKRSTESTGADIPFWTWTSLQQKASFKHSVRLWRENENLFHPKYEDSVLWCDVVCLLL